MRLLILAGGKGERLLPLTKYHPKALTSIHGKAFLWYLFNLYAKHDIVLSVGHMADSIRFWCKEHGYWPEYVQEDRPMGHGGAIAYAQPFLDNNKIFAVANGDTFHNIDIAEVC